MPEQPDWQRILSNAKRILYVDDQPYYHDLVRRRFNGPGQTVVSAFSAGHALQKLLAGETFDAIVTDVDMEHSTAAGLLFGKSSGGRLIKQVRRLEKAQGATEPTPIIVASGQIGRVPRSVISRAWRPWGPNVFIGRGAKRLGALTAIPKWQLFPDAERKRWSEAQTYPKGLARHESYVGSKRSSLRPALAHLTREITARFNAR